MTGLAVHRDRVLAVGGRHLVVVAPHAAWEVVVPDVVRVGLPVGVHVGEDRLAVGLGGEVGALGDELRIFGGRCPGIRSCRNR